MASKKVVELVDDLDGGPAAETVRFALDDVEYAIDLSTDHAVKLREALAAFIGHARRAGGSAHHARRDIPHSTAAPRPPRPVLSTATSRSVKSKTPAKVPVVPPVPVEPSYVVPAPTPTTECRLAALSVNFQEARR